MSDYREVINNVWVKDNIVSKFNDLECVIFDCDGTLVNINNSYNACIKHTTGFILEKMTGRKQWYDLVTDEMILKLRISGGFNSDTDTTYVAILGAIAADTSDVGLAQKFISNIITHADERGIESIEQHLSDLNCNGVIKKVKDELKYSGLGTSNLLGTVFDEYFYGKELFKIMHRKEPIFNNSHGFIDKDQVVISEESVRSISNIFNGKIAIVSGRSRLATQHTLKSILNHFNLPASVFIEDEEKEEKIKSSQIKKPSPYALLKSMQVLNANNGLFVGDSIEDMLMAKKASENDDANSVFCGVYGAVSDRDFQFNTFKKRDVDVIIENVNILPRLLTLFEH